jgi:Zn-dependent protease/predicted transcriptional regulator
MTRSLRIGRLFGIDIEIDYTWFIVFALVAIGLVPEALGRSGLPDLPVAVRLVIYLLTALLFFGSVLLHELAHSIIALRNGLKITGITLFVLGGVSKMADEPKSAGVEFRIAIAGPLTSFVLAGVFGLLSLLARSLPNGAAVAAPFGWLALMNGVLAVFNLLPGFPLDGGRVLRAGIWRMFHSLSEATRIAATFGNALGVLMIVGGIFLVITTGNLGSLWLSLIGWFLSQAAQSSYQQLILRQALTGVPVSSVMTSPVEWVPADVTLDRVVTDYVMGRNHPAFPVIDNGQVLGLLCLTDIRNIARDRWQWTTAREAVPPLSDHYTIAPRADAWDALVRMSAENCGRLLVLENQALLGIVSRTDIMRLMRTRLELGV